MAKENATIKRDRGTIKTCGAPPSKHALSAIKVNHLNLTVIEMPLTSQHSTSGHDLHIGTTGVLSIKV